VEPYSTQSNPNFLFDNSAAGGANVTIGLASGAEAIGVGIADSDDIGGTPGDPVDITLQALGAGGLDLGTAFTINIPENTVNPGNGYYVVEDTTPTFSASRSRSPQRLSKFFRARDCRRAGHTRTVHLAASDRRRGNDRVLRLRKRA